MAYQKKVTKSKFDAIKILIQGGAKAAEIGKFLDLHENTVYAVKKCETYEEYEQFIAEKVAKRNAARAIKMRQAEEKKEQEKPVEPVQAAEPVQPQVIEHRQSVTIVANHYMAEQLQKQTELLTLISNKLAYIVEQLA